MKKLLAWALACWLCASPALATQIFLTVGSGTWAAPPDFSSTNTIECIGGGGGGGDSTTGKGGGGGAYAKIVNYPGVPGASISYSVGAGGSGSTAPTAGGDSWFGSTGTILAKGAQVTSGNGGLASASVGTTKYNGGNGGGAGGGGAAGPNGAGGNATSSGGAGDAGFGGAGGAYPGGAGGDGAEFDATHGSGGGGGGSPSQPPAPGLPGSYGAGGGAYQSTTLGGGVAGSAGLCVINYVPGQRRVSSGVF